MKRTALVQIRVNNDISKKIYGQFLDEVDKITVLPTGLEVTTDVATTGFIELLRLLETEHINHSVIESREYTKQELKEAAFFHVGVLYPWEHDVLKDAEYHGTKYIKNPRCERCGKVQASKLMLDVKKIGKRHFVHIRPELIITEYAKGVIESNQLSWL
ncbi:hypothetical protein A8990_12037 [Paenibacillus taihuensis]|uniref:Uncharacterized protein n=1 Tax=Paenibacillus taihuensis TaxID=1156355 RepID=A0A3D9RTD8_9BACL|nr:hypothetical protein [Paenibacillus taihuensis]REE80991.1 hypothetical protein A8990_12037 [Paenibacillus taihuensis]